MKLSQVIDKLQKLRAEHGDLPVTVQRCSDFRDFEVDDIEVLYSIDNLYGSSWKTRYYPHQWKDVPEMDKPRLIKHIHFVGN